MIRIPHVSVQRIVGLAFALVLSSAVLFGCSAAATPSKESGSSGSANTSEGSTAQSQKPAKVEEGVEAPDFEFATMDGSTAKLSDYKGDVVVLTFWATWCGYCMRDMPVMNEISQSFEDVQVVAINRGDRTADAQAKAEDLGYDFAWGLDEDGAINALYPANGIPYTVIINKDGVVSSSIPGSAPDMYAYLEKAVTKAGA